MSGVALFCTVRGCGQPLERSGPTFVCANRHAFDIARSGYVNLLQPQDRRSRNPGDTKEAVAARRRFMKAGHAQLLTDAISPLIDKGPVLDVGCGEGHHLASFRANEKHGVDISVPAIDLAARTYRDCQFIVANADRVLPYAAGSFAFVTSITARINAAEMHRVLRDDGSLVVAVAGPDDLIEIREGLFGEGTRVDRAASAIAALDSHFRLVERRTARTTTLLDTEAIADVMTSSYRAMRVKEREKLTELSAMRVTLSRELLLLKK